MHERGLIEPVSKLSHAGGSRHPATLSFGESAQVRKDKVTGSSAFAGVTLRAKHAPVKTGVTGFRVKPGMMTKETENQF
jgi:hypothetical protein